MNFTPGDEIEYRPARNAPFETGVVVSVEPNWLCIRRSNGHPGVLIPDESTTIIKKAAPPVPEPAPAHSVVEATPEQRIAALEEACRAFLAVNDTNDAGHAFGLARKALAMGEQK